MPNVQQIIAAGARQRGLDPAAVLAVAAGEGLSGRIGDNGTSFGPFQLHIGGVFPVGVVPRGQEQAWAMSPAGINYALDRIAQVAQGLRGPQAVETIIRRFERPKDPDSSVRNAIARLSGATSTMPAAVAAPTSPAQVLDADPRALGYVLANTRRLLNMSAPSPLLLSKLAAVPGQVTPSAPPAPTGGANQPASGTLPQGLDPAFSTALDRLLAAVPGLSVNSGYRTVERQRQLWEAAVRKYGSEAAARKWVAPPGRSRHNMGVAADLAGPLDQAAQLAPQFGLYRPMSWEPWHFELSGSR